MKKKIKRNNLSSIQEFREWIRENKRKEEIQQKRYGQVKPIIQVKLKGKRFVAVGSELFWLPERKTFTEFLTTYLWRIIGEEWFEVEKVKPFDEQHQIMKWWKLLCDFQQKQTLDDNGYYKAIPNGAYRAFLQLAYDLYILGHHQLLQNRIVERLKNPGNFQGARYELFATSTMIRVGYEIEFEDETDRSSKHVEFVGTKNDDKDKIAIEAKSRHRGGVLGQPGEIVDIDEMRLRIGSLINKAIEKNPKMPFIIFIDINLPVERAEKMTNDQSLKEFIKSVENVKTAENNKDLFNLILFTNHPYHYGRDDEPSPKSVLSLAYSQKPKYHFYDSKTVDNVATAVNQYENIPRMFPDEE